MMDVNVPSLFLVLGKRRRRRRERERENTQGRVRVQQGKSFYEMIVQLNKTPPFALCTGGPAWVGQVAGE